MGSEALPTASDANLERQREQVRNVPQEVFRVCFCICCPHINEKLMQALKECMGIGLARHHRLNQDERWRWGLLALGVELD